MNAEALTMPGPNGTKVVVINNARSTLPVVMTGENTEYLPLNANYTMTGDEDYVNSKNPDRTNTSVLSTRG